MTGRIAQSERNAGRDKLAVRTLLSALKPLSTLRGSIPLPYAVAFLAVAMDEGKHVGAYARELNLNRYVMSRYMRCIGRQARNGDAGLGLVAVRRTLKYPTRTEVVLTKKGRVVAEQVFRSLRPRAA